MDTGTTVKKEIRELDLTALEPVLDIVRSKYVDKGLKYGWKSTRKNGALDFGHWNNLILPACKAAAYDHGELPYIQQHPEIKFLWDQIQSVIGKRTLVRAYINGYTFGTDAYWHTDDGWIKNQHGPDSVSETVLIYLNKEWDRNWGGETAFIDDNDNFIGAALPKRNKAVVFDSDIWHRSTNLTRMCPVLRSVLVFKTAGPMYNEECVQWLRDKGTEKIKHSGTNLFHHLYNTAMYVSTEFRRIKWYIVRAALFHSIYGTAYFDPKLNVTRQEIRDLIGEEAEDLAYTFCSIEGNRFEAIITNKGNWMQEKHFGLCVLELANMKEMLERKPMTKKHYQRMDALNKLIESFVWRRKYTIRNNSKG